MMTKIKELLTFLRLVDEDGTVSLSSVALIVMLYRVAMCQEVSFTEMGAFLAAVANYSGKRWINSQTAESGTAETLADLGMQMQAAKTEIQVLQNRTQPGARR